MRVELDCSLMTGRAETHDYLKEKFFFPEYYGNNLDALHDCLTDLDNVEITITVPEEDGAIFQKVQKTRYVGGGPTS